MNEERGRRCNHTRPRDSDRAEWQDRKNIACKKGRPLCNRPRQRNGELKSHASQIVGVYLIYRFFQHVAVKESHLALATSHGGHKQDSNSGANSSDHAQHRGYTIGTNGSQRHQISPRPSLSTASSPPIRHPTGASTQHGHHHEQLHKVCLSAFERDQISDARSTAK